VGSRSRRIRRAGRRPEMPFYLLGHSTGTVYGALTAFVDTGAARIVAANRGHICSPRDNAFVRLSRPAGRAQQRCAARYLPHR
jgi:hypothetical protein